ncbi:MAG: hypothetical protein ABI835_10945 [Chloroflexota bacterium]
MFRKLLLISAVLLVAACSQIGIPGGAVVPTTGNTSSDPSSASQFVPDLPGYVSTDATSISTAVSRITGSASILTGNPITAALIAQVDGMISCYQSVGAVSAKVYAEVNIGSIAQGQIPAVGALAVINQDRLVNNFLPCALGSNRGFSAQDAQPQPCSSSGTFTVNGETLWYVYAASKQELCTTIAQHLPAA